MASNVPIEKIPRFKQRVGDTVLAGPSNSIVVLGRDRSKDGSDDMSAANGAGSVSIVAGRKTEGFDPEIDAASVYICALTDVDNTFKGTLETGEVGSAVVSLGDSVRIKARNSVIIVCGSSTIKITSDCKITIDGDVEIGKDAISRAVKEAAVDYLLTHTHAVPTGGGISGPPTPTASRESFLSNNCKLK